MADRWMDQRDRDWRDRDWRRSEAFGRSDWRRGYDRGRSGASSRWDEDRTWAGADDEGPSYEDTGRGRAYGEDEEDYGGRSGLTSGGAYGGGGYGRAGGGRPQAYQSERYGAQQRFGVQDYTRGGYADEAGRSDYGYRQRQGGGGRDDWRRDQDYREGRDWAEAGQRRYERDDERRYDEDARWRARSYEDDRDRERERWEGRRDQGRSEGAGDFLQRAGERISSWFRGDSPRGREERRDEPRRYSADFGREARWVVADRGHRGVGPKGYKRSDDRINEEVHERLTDDPWLDATDVHVEVKDGEVTLSGHVDNREAKHRAERLIEDISGVGHVQNNLRVDPGRLTGAGRGYGSSALEAEMRRNAEATSPGNLGASGQSGRTSTGAAAQRSTGAGSESSTGPKAGKRS